MGGVEVNLYNYSLFKVAYSLQLLYRKSITPAKIEFMPECDSCHRKLECGGFFCTTKAIHDIIVEPY